MKRSERNQLIEDFWGKSDSIKDQLSDMLDLIVDGKVPSAQDVRAFDEAMDALQADYASIRTLTQEIVCESELPAEGSSVSAYIKAIETSEKNRVAEKLAEISAIIEKFVSVRSRIAAYADALQPYQNEADAMLEKLKNITDGDIPDEITDASNAHELFIKAMDVEDFGNEQAIELLDGIDKHFASRVQVGLAQKKYFFPQESKPPANDQKGEPDTDAACESDADRGERPPISGEENSNNKMIAEEGQIDDSLLESKRPIRPVSAGASAFESATPEVLNCFRMLYPLFTNLGVLTAIQAKRFGVCMDCFNLNTYPRGIEIILQVLMLEGYVVSYKSKVLQDTVYCLSAFGYEYIRNEEIEKEMRTLRKVPCGNYEFVGAAQMEERRLVDAVNNNALLLSYLEGIKSQVSRAEYSVIQASLRWDKDCYQVAVFGAGQQYTCKVMGSPLDIHDGSDAHILIVASELPAMPVSDLQEVFAYVGDVLYHLRDEWSAVQPVAHAVAEPEAAPAPNDPAIVSEEERPLPTLLEGQTPDTPATHDPPIPEATSNPAESTPNDSAEIPDVQENNAAEPDESAPHTLAESALCDPLASVKRMIDSPQVPSDEEFVSLVNALLDAPAKDNLESGKYLTKAILLAKAASFIGANQACLGLSQQLSMATNLLRDKAAYSSFEIEPLFPENNAHTEGMMLATYMIALLSPSHQHDYTLYNRAKKLHDAFEDSFPSYPYIKPLFHKLLSVETIAPEGFSDSIVVLLGDAAEKSTFLQTLQENAKALLVTPVIKAKMNGLPELCSACFGPSSDLYRCMEIIANDNHLEKEAVAATVSAFSSDMGERVDRAWNEATWGKRTNRLHLGHLAREQVEDAFQKRLDLMKSWIAHVDNRDDKNLPLLKSLKTDLLQLIADAEATLNESIAVGNDRVVMRSLAYMRQKLSGEEKRNPPFADLLLTGYISLDDEWNPILHPAMSDVKYDEPWRNVLRHIDAPELSYEEIEAGVFDSSSRLFDNLQQLEMVGKRWGENPDAFVITDADLRAATDSAEDHTKRFVDKLEMAYTYNRIDETDKESIRAIMAQHKDTLLETKDFACWRSFLNALDRQVNEIAGSRKTHLRAILSAKRATLASGVTAPLLDEAEAQLEQESNFAVAEEYINRFDNGEMELSKALHSVLYDVNSFSDFLSDAVFLPIYAACMEGTGKTLRSFGTHFLEKHWPDDWTARQKENSKKMVYAWPVWKDAAINASRIGELFQYIGLNVTRVEKIQHPKSIELYQLHVTKTARDQPDYTHPISAFGTKLKSPLSVVTLYGNYTAKQLVDTIASLNLAGMALVLLDYAYDTATRRQMAEIFRTKTSQQNTFLLIDQVLLLYLAMHQETERLPILLKCTLPYTTYQPFNRDNGSTADEMFCGRTRELSEIMDPGGPVFIYGGRQLGKTALLERAENRCSEPERKEYAVYSNIISCRDESAFVDKLVSDINKKTDLTLEPVSSILALCQQLDPMFRSAKIESLLLLIDEADNFLASISEAKYEPLLPLIELKQETKKDFRFVFAGLHNVCRAKNATADNAVFGQFGTPLCIKPLSPTDALLLVSRPLRYLGFQIDQYPHLETILTNTNYYPGILQFFGNTLVQTFNSNYANFYRATAGHPPFTLQDEQLGAVMNSACINESIRSKFHLTLELDPRYFMLARCITMLYHWSEEKLSQPPFGFSVDEIREMADVCEIRCLENEDHANCIVLLDEMVDMGILIKSQEEVYRLRRRSFVNIIGSDMDRLEKEIERNNEEVI